MSRELLPPEAEQILVWHQGALGDVLLAAPALQAVAAAYPKARLTLVGNMAQLDLLRDTLPVAAVWSGHQSIWLELFEDRGEIGSRLKNLLSPFDLALVLTPTARPEFLQRFKTAGIRQVVWLPSFPERARVPIGDLHAAHLKAAGLKNSLKPFGLILPDSESAPARLQARNKNSIFQVALAPGSGHPRKNWPVAHYVELSKHLEERYEAQVWWVLGPAEADRLPELQSMTPHLRLLQDLPLRQLAARLAGLQLYVGNDSGVTHLAAALEGPVVFAIFGPSDPITWAPAGERTVVIAPEQLCAPCTRGREINCPEAVCLATLKPEKILAAIQKIFPEKY